MKRHIIRISLVMLLGVVTSVAVAWGCAWRVQKLPDHRIPFDAAQSFDEPLDDGKRWQGFGHVFGWYASFSDRVGLEATTWDEASKDDVPRWLLRPNGPPRPRLQVAAGCPSFCLRGVRFGDYETGPRSWLLVVNDVAIPLRPILPGLLANTAIYGGVWFAMLFGPGMFIRRRRRRAGRCAKCGYDLRGLSPESGSEGDRVCPECGAAR